MTGGRAGGSNVAVWIVGFHVSPDDKKIVFAPFTLICACPRSTATSRIAPCSTAISYAPPRSPSTSASPMSTRNGKGAFTRRRPSRRRTTSDVPAAEVSAT